MQAEVSDALVELAIYLFYLAHSSLRSCLLCNQSDFGMLLAGQFVAESTLFEPELIASIMQFFEGSSRYTLGLAFNVPPDTLVQPSQCDVLPEEVPPSYAYLPSYVAENASKTIKVLGSYPLLPSVLSSSSHSFFPLVS